MNQVDHQIETERQIDCAMVDGERNITHDQMLWRCEVNGGTVL